jgi:hypothetical protein
MSADRWIHPGFPCSSLSGLGAVGNRVVVNGRSEEWMAAG